MKKMRLFLALALMLALLVSSLSACNLPGGGSGNKPGEGTGDTGQNSGGSNGDSDSPLGDEGEKPGDGSTPGEGKPDDGDTPGGENPDQPGGNTPGGENPDQPGGNTPDDGTDEKYGDVIGWGPDSGGDEMLEYLAIDVQRGSGSFILNATGKLKSPKVVITSLGKTYSYTTETDCGDHFEYLFVISADGMKVDEGYSAYVQFNGDDRYGFNISLYDSKPGADEEKIGSFLGFNTDGSKSIDGKSLELKYGDENAFIYLVFDGVAPMLHITDHKLDKTYSIDSVEKIDGYSVYQFTLYTSLMVDGDEIRFTGEYSTASEHFDFQFSLRVSVTGAPTEHKHVFIDGKCECGEVDPDYVQPGPILGTFLGLNNDGSLDYETGVTVVPTMEKVSIYLLFDGEAPNLSLLSFDLSIPYCSVADQFTLADGAIYVYRFDLPTIDMREGASYSFLGGYGTTGENQTNINFILTVGTVDDPGEGDDHKHVFIGGKCECGEVDPDYENPGEGGDHTHVFVDGECECGAVDPDYGNGEENPPRIFGFYDPESMVIADFTVNRGEGFSVYALFMHNHNAPLRAYIDGFTIPIEQPGLIEGGAVETMEIDGESYYAVRFEVPPLLEVGRYDLELHYFASLDDEECSWFTVSVTEVYEPIGNYLGVNAEQVEEYSDSATLYVEGDTVYLHVIFDGAVENLSIYCTDLYIPYLVHETVDICNGWFYYVFLLPTSDMSYGEEYYFHGSYGTTGENQTNFDFSVLVLDPNDEGEEIPDDHQHSFSNGKCYCGAIDPDYVPEVDITDLLVGAMTPEMTGPSWDIGISLEKETELYFVFKSKVEVTSISFFGDALSFYEVSSYGDYYTVAAIIYPYEKYESDLITVTYNAEGDSASCDILLTIGSADGGDDEIPPRFLGVMTSEDEGYSESVSVIVGRESVIYLAFDREISCEQIIFYDAEIWAEGGHWMNEYYLIEVRLPVFTTIENPPSYMFNYGNNEDGGCIIVNVLPEDIEPPAFVGAWSDSVSEMNEATVTVNPSMNGLGKIYVQFSDVFNIDVITLSGMELDSGSYGWNGNAICIDLDYTSFVNMIGEYDIVIIGSFGNYEPYLPIQLNLILKIEVGEEPSFLGIMTEDGELSDGIVIKPDEYVNAYLIFDTPVYVQGLYVDSCPIITIDSTGYELSSGQYAYNVSLSAEQLGYFGKREVEITYSYYGTEYKATVEIEVDVPRLVGIFDGDTGMNVTDPDDDGYNVYMTKDAPLVLDFVYTAEPSSVRMDKGDGDFEGNYTEAVLLGYEEKLGGYVARFTLSPKDVLEQYFGEKLSVAMYDLNYSFNFHDGGYDEHSVILVKFPESEPKTYGINVDGYSTEGTHIQAYNDDWCTFYIMFEGVSDSSLLCVELFADGDYADTLYCEDLTYDGVHNVARFTFIPSYPADATEDYYLIYKVRVVYNGQDVPDSRGNTVTVFVIEVVR